MHFRKNLRNFLESAGVGAGDKGSRTRSNSIFYTYLDLPENIYEEIDIRGNNDSLTIEKRPAQALRTLWAETDAVIASGILGTMSSSDRALQESKFEILTSEVSYLKSLNVLITLFVESLELAAALQPEERSALFSNILEVRRASEIFLFDLAGHWEEDYMLNDIYTVVHRHTLASFRVYIEYCSNQVHFHRTLQKLLVENKDFTDILIRFETSPECHGYSLQSFLTLPMQRVTRLPLLLQAIQRRLDIGTEEFSSCRVALSSLNQLVHECNEGVRKEEQNSQIQALSNILNEDHQSQQQAENEDNPGTPSKHKTLKRKLVSSKSWQKFFTLQSS